MSFLCLRAAEYVDTEEVFSEGRMWVDTMSHWYCVNYADAGSGIIGSRCSWTAGKMNVWCTSRLIVEHLKP